MFSASFAGIAPASVPGFITAQIIGGFLAVALVKVLYREEQRNRPLASSSPIRPAKVPWLRRLLIDDGTSAALFSSDTAPTDVLWDAANATPHLKAIFLEATFPEGMADLANVAMHLTPRLFAAELAKLRRPAQVFAVHIKPRYHDQVVAELRALGLPNLRITEPGETYTV